jgi:hypothetical protein
MDAVLTVLRILYVATAASIVTIGGQGPQLVVLAGAQRAPGFLVIVGRMPAYKPERDMAARLTTELQRALGELPSRCDN